MNLDEFLTASAQDPQIIKTLALNPNKFLTDNAVDAETAAVLTQLSSKVRAMAFETPVSIADLAGRVNELPNIDGNLAVAFSDTYTDHYIDDFTDSYTNSDARTMVDSWAQRLVMDMNFNTGGFGT